MQGASPNSREGSLKLNSRAPSGAEKPETNTGRFGRERKDSTYVPFAKYEVNGDKIVWIVLDDFLHSGQNTIPLFVIPAQAGTQIRDDPVDRVFPGISLLFPRSRTSGSRASRG
jgi:hypothetical protein